jgi:hypothetical protein
MRMLDIALAFLILAIALTSGGCLLRHQSRGAMLFHDSATTEELDAWVASMKGATPHASMFNLWKWWQDNGTYVPDGIINYPRDPRVTYKIKTGNCNDTSFLFTYAAKRMAQFDECYFATVVSVHSVCLVKIGDFWYHFSNWNTGIYGPFADKDEAANTVSPGRKFALWSDDLTLIEWNRMVARAAAEEVSK